LNPLKLIINYFYKNSRSEFHLSIMILIILPSCYFLSLGIFDLIISLLTWSWSENVFVVTRSTLEAASYTFCSVAGGELVRIVSKFYIIKYFNNKLIVATTLAGMTCGILFGLLMWIKWEHYGLVTLLYGAIAGSVVYLIYNWAFTHDIKVKST